MGHWLDAGTGRYARDLVLSTYCAHFDCTDLRGDHLAAAVRSDVEGKKKELEAPGQAF